MSGQTGANRGGSKPSAAERPNTLGWNERDLAVVLDAMEARAKESGTNAKRDFARWPFRKVTINARVFHPGGTIVFLKLACRNISRGGIGLLHNAYIHPGTKCSVTIPLVSGGLKEIVGKVRRCVHVRGTLHELGVAFDTSIDLRQYLDAAKTPDFFSLEKVDPTRLSGKLLYLDDNELDIRIIQHYFREATVQLRTTTKPQEAIQLAQEGVDLILTDWLIPEMSGTQFLQELRRQRIDTPAIIMTADPMGLMQEGFASLQNVMLLSKPVQQTQLLRAVAEQLMLLQEAKGKGPQAREAGTVDPKFVPVIEGYADKVGAEIEKEDFATALSLCSNLKANAVSLGAMTVAEACTAAVNAIAAEDKHETIRLRLREVMACCKRVAAASKG